MNDKDQERRTMIDDNTQDGAEPSLHPLVLRWLSCVGWSGRPPTLIALAGRAVRSVVALSPDMALTRKALSRTIKATAMSANWRQQYIRRTRRIRSGEAPVLYFF
jgi:hypothetical protein